MQPSTSSSSRMAENIPPGDEIPELNAGQGDNPPEPTSSNSSTQAVRGSPAHYFNSHSPSVLDPGTPSAPPVPDPFVGVSVSSPQPPVPPTPSSSQQQPAEPAPPSVDVPSSSTSSSIHPSDPPGIQVNREQLSSLLEFGFDEWTAVLALQKTGGVSVEAAVNWIIERSNVDDYQEDGHEDSDDDMGAAESRTHKMVFVANMSLKMGSGKLAAQVGHATLSTYRLAQGSEQGRAGLEAWRRTGEMKIVLRGRDTEHLMDLLKESRDRGLVAYLVADAGHTQIPAGSRTVLGIFGSIAEVDAVTGQLKLL